MDTHDNAAPFRPRPARTSRFTGGLALSLAVLSLLASAYLGLTFLEKRGIYRADMFSRLDQLEAATSALRKTTGQQQSRLDDITARATAATDGMATLRRDFAQGRSAWLAAEAEQLLVIAGHRLALAHDPVQALAALEAADRQLRFLADPAYLPVRAALAREIARVGAAARTDLPGMSLRLAELAHHLDELPLAVETRFRAPAEAATRPPSGSSLWRDLLDLIRVRHGEAMRVPLVPQEQRYFVRENLRLMLLGAQTALLTGQVAVFEEDIALARGWLTKHFDIAHPGVQHARDGLTGMMASPFRAPLPELGDSLKLLRTARPE